MWLEDVFVLGGGREDFIVNTKEGKISLGTAALDGQL